MCNERLYNGNFEDHEEPLGAISTIYFIFAIILGGKVLPATFIGIVAIQVRHKLTRTLQSRLLHPFRTQSQNTKIHARQVISDSKKQMISDSMRDSESLPSASAD